MLNFGYQIALANNSVLKFVDESEAISRKNNMFENEAYMIPKIANTPRFGHVFNMSTNVPDMAATSSYVIKW